MAVGPHELRRRAAVAKALFWTALTLGGAVWFVLVVPTAAEHRWLAVVAALVLVPTSAALGLLRRPKAPAGKPNVWAVSAIAAGLAPAVAYAPPPLYAAILAVVTVISAFVAGIAWREVGLPQARVARDDLPALLAQLRDLLDDFGEDRWVAWCDRCIAALDAEDPNAVRLVLGAAGGMGSLDDVVLHRPTRLRSSADIARQPRPSTDEEQEANARFLEIKAAIWDAAGALERGWPGI